MSHLSQKQLIAFAAGRSGAREAERAYGHLDACDACAQRLEAVRRIRSDFDGSWDEFLTELATRVEAWETSAATEVFAGVELAIRGVLDEGRRLATAALDRVTGAVGDLGSLDAAFQPAYSGVGDPATAGEAADLTQQASALCGEGKDDEAVRRLERAAGLDPRAGASAGLSVLAGGRKVGEVVVDARRRSVSVLLDLDHAGVQAVLSHGSGRIPDMSSELQPVEGASYALAEFENVPAGPFSLRLRFPAA